MVKTKKTQMGTKKKRAIIHAHPRPRRRAKSSGPFETPVRVYFDQTASKNCIASSRSDAFSEPLLSTDFASRHMLPLICVLTLIIFRKNTKEQNTTGDARMVINF